MASCLLFLPSAATTSPSTQILPCSVFDLDLLVLILSYIYFKRQRDSERDRGSSPHLQVHPCELCNDRGRAGLKRGAWNTIRVSQERLDLTETALIDWPVAAEAQLPASSSRLLGSASTESWNQEPELGTEPSHPAGACGLHNC